ncbi:MAG: hypothetical protein ABSF29_01335 [Tepidisphaeraceae bacterium]
MKWAKTCAVAVMTLVVLLAQGAKAQVMQFVPSASMMVYRVGNLESLSKKVADFCGTLGLTQMNPDLADPLGMICKQKGISAGLNRSGDLAMVLMDPAAVGGNMNNSVMVLIPVSDYQAFLGNFPGATTEGDISTVPLDKNNPVPVFMAHWGGYAVASPFHDLVVKPPTDVLTVGPLAQKELDSKDVVMIANVKELRGMALPQIEKMRTQATQQIDDQAAKGGKIGALDMSKMAPVAKVFVNQVINLVEEFTNDMDDATISANLSPDGIGQTTIMEFRPDTKLGKLVAQSKMTDATLTSGLPDGKYLFFGGSVADPQQASQFLSDFIDPIEQSITTLGPDFSSFNDAIDAMKAMVQAQTAQRVGLFVPTGTLGQDPLLQVFVESTGDSKTMLTSTHKANDAWQTAMKTLGMDQAAGTTTDTAAAKTVDGVTFDEFQTTLNMGGQSPQQMQAMQFMMFLYGPNGPEKFVGPVNDQSLLTYSGLSDPTVTAVIDAIKANDDPLASTATVKAVAAELPTQRMSAFYIPLDQWASTGLNYAKQFASMDMGVKIPEDLPPVGVTISADGSALRVDGYIPAQLVDALTQAGMQVFTAMAQPHNVQPGAAPQGGGPGGGL